MTNRGLPEPLSLYQNPLFKLGANHPRVTFFSDSACSPQKKQTIYFTSWDLVQGKASINALKVCDEPVLFNLFGS